MGRLNGHIAIAWADDRQAFTAQTGGHRSITGHQRQPNPLTTWSTRQTPAARIQLLRRNPAAYQQLAQQPQALTPEQGHIVIGFSQLAARALALSLHRLSRHPIELRQQPILSALNSQLLQPLIQIVGLWPTLLHTCGDQLKGQKQGPLAFDAFKTSQLLGLVVQACAVLHHGLMAIAAKRL